MVVVIGRFIAAELGAASTATAAVLLIEVLSSAGILEAVVRSRSGQTLVTGIVMAMAFAFLAMGLCALAAFPIAAMFADDRLISLTIAASLVVQGRDLAGQKQETRKAATLGELCDAYLAASEAGRVLTRHKKAGTLAMDNQSCHTR